MAGERELGTTVAGRGTAGCGRAARTRPTEEVRCVSRLTVVGAGYVGLVTVACMAELGHDVVAMDVDADKIHLLRAGGVPIYEPGLAELIAANRERDRVHHRSGIRLQDERVHLHLRGHSAHLLGRRRPLPHLAGRRQPPPRRGRARPHHQVDRPGGHRSAGPGGAGPARLPAHQLRLQPGVPARGHGHRRLHAAPTAWSSARTIPASPSGWPASTRASTAPSSPPTWPPPR